MLECCDAHEASPLLSLIQLWNICQFYSWTLSVQFHNDWARRSQLHGILR